MTGDLHWCITIKPSLSDINIWCLEWSIDVYRTVQNHFRMATMSLMSLIDTDTHIKNLLYGNKLGSFDYTKQCQAIWIVVVVGNYLCWISRSGIWNGLTMLPSHFRITFWWHHVLEVTYRHRPTHQKFALWYQTTV